MTKLQDKDSVKIKKQITDGINNLPEDIRDEEHEGHEIEDLKLKAKKLQSQGKRNLDTMSENLKDKAKHARDYVEEKSKDLAHKGKDVKDKALEKGKKVVDKVKDVLQ